MIREALVQRVQPDVAAAVKEAIDVRKPLNNRRFSSHLEGITAIPNFRRRDVT